MKKSDIAKDIKKQKGTFMSISDIAKYLGIGRDTARNLMDGVDYIRDGRSKKYFADDIAEKIISMRQV